MNRRYWLAVATSAGIGWNTLRLRRRLGGLTTIVPSSEPVHPGHVFLTAPGVSLDEAQRRAASAHARRHGLAVLDLVPDELPPDRLLDLARMLDTTTYRQSLLAVGRGAYQALLVDREVLARAGLDPRPRLAEAGLVDLLVTLKRFAPASTGVAVLPGLRPAPRTGADRFAVQAAAYVWEPHSLVCPALRDLALAAGAGAAPGWAAAGAALSLLQPLAVAGGRFRLRPADLLASWLTRRRALLELLADVAHLATPTGLLY
ncbi:MAG: methyltransferase type 12, partial [Frankia sp.]|nr:methyltransferase type 12 [Frankia sp.]